MYTVDFYWSITGFDCTLLSPKPLKATVETYWYGRSSNFEGPCHVVGISFKIYRSYYRYCVNLYQMSKNSSSLCFEGLKKGLIFSRAPVATWLRCQIHDLGEQGSNLLYFLLIFSYFCVSNDSTFYSFCHSKIYWQKQ